MDKRKGWFGLTHADLRVRRVEQEDGMDSVTIREVVVEVPRSERDVRQGIKVDATNTARAFVADRFGWTDATVEIERQEDRTSTFRVTRKGE